MSAQASERALSHATPFSSAAGSEGLNALLVSPSSMRVSRPLRSWIQFDPSAGAPAAQELSLRLDARLAEILEPARRTPYGPDRVFAYLWDLFRENRSLRAALAGLAAQAEPELVAQSLRGVSD